MARKPRGRQRRPITPILDQDVENGDEEAGTRGERAPVRRRRIRRGRPGRKTPLPVPRTQTRMRRRRQERLRQELAERDSHEDSPDDDPAAIEIVELDQSPIDEELASLASDLLESLDAGSLTRADDTDVTDIVDDDDGPFAEPETPPESEIDPEATNTDADSSEPEQAVASDEGDEDEAAVLELSSDELNELEEEEEEPELLEAVRNALDGAQSATVHADYALRGINHELRAISQRQSTYESKAVMNSVFSYVIFCVLIFGALYFVFDLRNSKNTVDERYYETELEAQAERLKLLEAELEKYRVGSHHAFEVFQLIEQARNDEALERYNEVRDHVINPAEAALLEDRVESVRWKLASAGYREALDFYNKDNYEQARDAFFRSISYQENTPYTHLLQHHLGMALFNLGDFQGARHYLSEALQKDLPSSNASDARFYYAVATENVGMENEAFDLYDKFLKRYRSSNAHSEDAQRRMGRIERARARERIAARRAARERQIQLQEAEAKAAKGAKAAKKAAPDGADGDATPSTQN